MENEKKITDAQLEKVNGGEDNDKDINLPKCPKCGSKNVGVHVEGGMACGYHCFDCNHDW